MFLTHFGCSSWRPSFAFIPSIFTLHALTATATTINPIIAKIRRAIYFLPISGTLSVGCAIISRTGIMTTRAHSCTSGWITLRHAENLAFSNYLLALRNYRANAEIICAPIVVLWYFRPNRWGVSSLQFFCLSNVCRHCKPKRSAASPCVFLVTLQLQLINGNMNKPFPSSEITYGAKQNPVGLQVMIFP